MVVLPISRSAVTRPLLSIVATAVSDELQATWVVISLVVPSEYVPVACSCISVWKDKNGLAGITVMKARGTAVAVRVVLPEIIPEVAVIVVVPAEAAVAKPVLLTVATDILEEVQVTRVVIS